MVLFPGGFLCLPFGLFGFFLGFPLRRESFLFRLFLLEASLGRDQHDPVGAPHPIDGGTSVLEDFHGLDVHRVDGVDVRAGRVVHEDEGLSGRIDGILTPIMCLTNS